MNRRVVITGLGVVSPIGNDVSTFSSNLKKGESGEGPLTRFQLDDFPVNRVYELKNFTSPSSVRRLDPFIQYAVSSADQALADANLQITDWNPYEVGIVMSSSKGGLTTYCRDIEKFNNNRRALMAARIYSSFVPNIAAQWIARQKKIKGPAVCFVTACATGTVSIIEAAEMVRRGEVNICIAGASDASICPLALAGYHSIGVYAPSAMLPFSKKRAGFQVGEGAGCLILEPLEQALERGAKIYGEVGAHGYGCNTSHIVRFSSEEATLTKVINLALEREGLKPEEISYINCHATGTEEGDIYEVEQLRKVFGPQLSHIPMSATKSMTGHMLGASGTVEILATLLGMRDGFYPPTGRLEDIDGVFKDLDLIPNQAREGQFEKALTYSLAFGGHVAALVLKKYHG